jgi:hypothetical protein
METNDQQTLIEVKSGDYTLWIDCYITDGPAKDYLEITVGKNAHIEGKTRYVDQPNKLLCKLSDLFEMLPKLLNEIEEVGVADDLFLKATAALLEKLKS